jgi:secreted PhoX family phosphatase
MDVSQGSSTAGAEREGLTRRRLLKAGVLGGALLAMDGAFARQSFASARFGPLGQPDANGLQLPAGYQSRVVARSTYKVGSTAYKWHGSPDGGRCFSVSNGWVYVSNCERDGTGGVGMVRFNQSGAITDARRLLDGTYRNCSGGHTPWGTWLSCEEVLDGRVWEVDPLGTRAPAARLNMGRFNHEGAAVDGTPSRQAVYMTEDSPDGCFYRFRYTKAADLSAGALEAAQVTNGVVTWLTIPDPSGTAKPTKRQAKGVTRFDGGEGIWYDNGVVNFATKGDDRVWAYDVVTRQLRVVYDWTPAGANAVLRGVDNLAVRNGDVYVCEDLSAVDPPRSRDPQICVIERTGEVSVFVRAVGHIQSELTGAAFNPTGDRLYFSSQRGADGKGVTFEVTGPFPS